MKGQSKVPLYHRRSIRLPGYDYSAEGEYFVTLVTKDRECLFGEVIDEEMRLNESGKIVKEEWLKTTVIRSNVETLEDEFVIMPNHIHGIIRIFGESIDGQNEVQVGEQQDAGMSRGDLQEEKNVFVRAYSYTPLQNPNRFRSPSKSVGSIVRGFKTSVTTLINTLRGTPGKPVWLRNYYEHIITTDKEYVYIVNYIQENPMNWVCGDEYFKL